MYSRALELAVGLFIMLGIGALFVLALKISGLSLTATGQTYQIYGEFTDVGGLRVRGKVSLAGVTIGQVKTITLDPQSLKARVEMEIDAAVNYLSRDSIAVISTAGLLGEKYVDISVGGDEETLQDGDYFESTQGALNLEKLISNFATSNL
jgi:phospholipid/cholesterol/gamma-HCH transport system substrate-binding protein